MSRIREKATESEAVVRNITKDIQVLDLAKKNLILSMTTLKRLQMLGASPEWYFVDLLTDMAFSQRVNTARGFNPGEEVPRDGPNTICEQYSFFFLTSTYFVFSLQAVKQISASFKPYTSVQRISQVWRRVQELQGEIRSHLDADFDKLYVVIPHAYTYCFIASSATYPTPPTP